MRSWCNKLVLFNPLIEEDLGQQWFAKIYLVLQQSTWSTSEANIYGVKVDTQFKFFIWGTRQLMKVKYHYYSFCLPIYILLLFYIMLAQNIYLFLCRNLIHFKLIILLFTYKKFNWSSIWDCNFNIIQHAFVLLFRL